MQCVRVNSNYAEAVRYFVEVRQVRHILAVLIQTVKKDYNRIALLRVVPLGPVHHECPGDVANSHCFLWILRTDQADGQQAEEARSRKRKEKREDAEK